MSKWHPVASRWVQCSYCGRLEWIAGTSNEHFVRFRLREHMRFHYEREMKRPWKRFLMLIKKYEFGRWKDFEMSYFNNVMSSL